jgi:NodT family efflux transporter outer membrane factor (OMF) lipoprotein
LFAVTAVAILGACAPMPPQSQHQPMLDAASVGLQGQPGEAIDPQWWHMFGDPQLNDLVEKSLANNPSLRVAQARLTRAQSVADNVRGNDLPRLELQADVTHQLYSTNFIYPPPIGGSILDSGDVQVNASWELDFFGKNRAALESALGQVRSAQADAQAARNLLASNVVRSYFQWLKWSAQREIAGLTLAGREQSKALVSDRLAAGLDTQLEFQQSDAAIPEARFQVEQITEQQNLALNALAALTGQQKEPLQLVAPPAAQFKSGVATIAKPQSIPLDLLGRRADVEAARWRVEAATNDVANAKTLFYPNINLVAFAGFQSIGLEKVLSSGSAQWGVGPSIRLPIFDAGHLRANLNAKSADLDAAIASYNAQVIEAVHDVADQITSSRAIERQQAEQALALSNAEDRYAIAQQRYKAGLVTYLSVLNAGVTLLNQHRQAIDISARARDAQIQLIHSLGGGYTSTIPANSTP